MQHLFQAALCGLLMLRCTAVVPKPRNPDNHNLSKNIIPDGYLKEIRPPTLQGKPIVVDFTMRVVDINSINVEDMDFRMDMFLKQQWTDARIRIPEEMFEYRDDFITLPSQFFDSLWQPDLYFLSSKVVEIATLTHKFSSVSLYRNKTIRYSARMHAIVACQMEFYHYPMDTQVCPVSVESFSYNNQKMLLRWTEPGVTISPELKLLQYNILQPLHLYQKGVLTSEKNGNFSRLVVLLKFERQIGHHLIQTFAPSTLVVVLSWFSFWLDLDAIPARVTLLVTCLLTLVTMFTGLRTDIPAVAYVKALDLWMAGCMVSVFASLGEFVIVKVLQGKYSRLKQKEAERAMATAITPWINEISINKMGRKAGKHGCLTLYWKTNRMSDKPDTVPGLGFKDKEKAQETLRNLEGRDPDYQKLAIKGLIGRAKRTLTLTKDKDKLQNITDAMKIFEQWLKDFETNNLAKDNRPYLPLISVQALLPLKEKYGLKDELAERFLKAYTEEGKGEYKNLRTISSGDGEPTWDIVRNKELKSLPISSTELWDDEDLPTKAHMKLIMWAYSPDAGRIKKNLSSYEEKLGNLKISSDEEATNESAKKGHKRKPEGSGSSSQSEGSSGSEDDEEAPKKKSKIL